MSYEGTLDLSAANSSLTLTGATTFSGANGSGAATINLNGAEFYNSYLYVLGTGTLDNATIDIGNPGYATNSLVNEDTAGTGGVLTLGPNLTLDLVNSSAALTSSDKAGDGIVNDGTINAGNAGGTLNIDATNFTNDGSITVSNDATLAIEGTNLANLSGSTLAGGSFEADANGTLLLPSNATILTDAANITLSGSHSVIESTADGVTAQIDSTLQTIASTGALNLLDGRNFTTASDFTDNGELQLGGPTFRAASLTVGATGAVFGSGTIVPGIVNDGTITAEGGQLDLEGRITGNGTLSIDPGAALELGGSTSEAVTFNPGTSPAATPAGGALKIDTTSGFTGTISGFAPGDTIDIVNLAVTSASIVGGNTLTVTTSGDGTQSFALTDTLAGDTVAVAGDGGTGSDLTIATTAPALTVSNITPDQGSNLGSVTLTIKGGQLNGGARAEVIAPDGTVRAATAVDLVNSGEAWATFNLEGLVTGTYDVEVLDGTQSATLAHAFQVTNGPTGHASVSLVLPQSLSSGQSGVIQVDYANTGQTDVVSPIIDLSSAGALLSATGVSGSGSNIQILGTNPDGPAGIRQPGATATLSVAYAPASPASGNAISFNASVMDASGAISSGPDHSVLLLSFLWTILGRIRPGFLWCIDRPIQKSL